MPRSVSTAGRAANEPLETSAITPILHGTSGSADRTEASFAERLHLLAKQRRDGLFGVRLARRQFDADSLLGAHFPPHRLLDLVELPRVHPVSPIGRLFYQSGNVTGTTYFQIPADSLGFLPHQHRR
jgi:hypothetical protein